jgi:hypothetical protein
MAEYVSIHDGRKAEVDDGGMQNAGQARKNVRKFGKRHSRKSRKSRRK